MLSVTIAAMKCGGCAAGVEKAIKGIDPDATVTVDLATKRVDIDSQANSDTIVGALDAAGFKAVQ